jgi:hypothetical protein
VQPYVVRYSERPELWDRISDLSDEVWPEYNQHGQTLNHYWGQLYEVFPDWQFVLYDAGDDLVLAEGNTIPIAWDGTDDGLGPGIDATIPPGSGGRRPAGSPRPSARWPPRSRRVTRAVTCRARCCRQCRAWPATRRSRTSSRRSAPI